MLYIYFDIPTLHYYIVSPWAIVMEHCYYCYYYCYYCHYYYYYVFLCKSIPFGMIEPSWC